MDAFSIPTEIYTLPRSPWMKSPLLLPGATIWWPFCKYYIVPCNTKSCDFIIGFKDSPMIEHYWVCQDRIYLGNIASTPPKTVQDTLQEWYKSDCYISNAFYWIDEPVGHSIQLWTPECDYNTGYDDCYLSLNEALKHVTPCGPGKRRAQITLKQWRRKRVSGLNKYWPNLTTRQYPNKKVYLRKK